MPNPNDKSKWLKRIQPSPHARVQLYCLPYAGGGASIYRPWAEGLADDIEVSAIQLPGHEERLMEPPFESAKEAAAALAQELRADLRGPFALFGYSMGALVAFETARCMSEQYGQGPVHLFAAAMRAPQVPPKGPSLHSLPESEFLAEVGRRYEAVPPEVAAEPDLMALLLPPLRADMAICDTYQFTPGARLDCAVSVLAGTGDSNISAADLEGWSELGARQANVNWYEGEHFFMRTQLPAVFQAVAQGLEGVGR